MLQIMLSVCNVHSLLVINRKPSKLNSNSIKNHSFPPRVQERPILSLSGGKKKSTPKPRPNRTSVASTSFLCIAQRTSDVNQTSSAKLMANHHQGTKIRPLVLLDYAKYIHISLYEIRNVYEKTI